jgi:hypothetical protein
MTIFSPSVVRTLLMFRIIKKISSPNWFLDLLSSADNPLSILGRTCISWFLNSDIVLSLYCKGHCFWLRSLLLATHSQCQCHICCVFVMAITFFSCQFLFLLSKAAITSKSRIYSFFFPLLVVLAFEFRDLYLLDRCSTT